MQTRDDSSASPSRGDISTSNVVKPDGPTFSSPSPPSESPPAMAHGLRSLLHLNGDILLYIVRMLSTEAKGRARKHDLCALSQTCSHMRRLCMSHIFGTCTVIVNNCITLKHLPPSSLWPHIKGLYFHNTRDHNELRQVISGRIIYMPSEPIEYTIKSELGSLFDPLLLDRQLRNMPNLRSVYVHGHRDGVHDISLAALKAILSVPHLRKFTMVNHEIYPCQDDAALETDADRGCEGLAPVTSFSYDVRMANIPPGYPAQVARQALSAILRGLAPSLETLCLPSIYAPVETIRETHWPLLRDFTVRGAHLDPQSTPYADLVKQMPNLRGVNFEIAHPHVAWPVGHPAAFPCLALEHLTLSNPSPDDAIYAHIPSSIRSFSLHSWPSQAYDVYLDKGKMSYAAWATLRPATPLPASVMLRVLQRCSHIASDLTRLHVEYVADEEEKALLRYIAATCPSLVKLEVHRCHPNDDTPQDPDWHLNTLGRACTSLTKLRALYVHTHLSDYPRRVHIPRMAIYYTEGQHHSYAKTNLLSTATALVCMLAPSVDTIAFLTPDNFWPRWAIYSVNGEGKERAARYEYHRPAEGGAGHSWQFGMDY